MDERAPAWPVLAASASVIVAAVALVSVGVVAHWVGWVAGSMLTAALVVTFRVHDRRASQHARYVGNPRLGRVANALLVCGLAVGTVNAFWIATELAK